MNQLTPKQLEEIINKAVANLATKDDLAKALANHPTKSDLKKALSNHPTKGDLKEALSKQSDDICKTMRELFEEADENKADKEDLEALEERVTALEQN